MIARSRALDVPIYAVTVVSPHRRSRAPSVTWARTRPGRGRGRRAARTLRGDVRRRRLHGSRLRRLQKAADQIANELKHQYRLGYDPPDGPRRFRRVEVRTTRKGVVVRTRSGYVPPS